MSVFKRMLAVMWSICVVTGTALATWYIVANIDSAPETQQSEGQSSEVVEAEQTATYRVVYVPNWSEVDYPNYAPETAHVSPAVVLAHDAESRLFTIDEVASDGIELMAETGATEVLTRELESRGLIKYETGVRLDPGETDEFTFEVNQQLSLLSFVSMLAPSPDWFVGLDSYELYDQDGGWVDTVEIDLVAYDAGADNGTRFLARDWDTIPAEPISEPVDGQLKEAAEVKPFAKLAIERVM
ncbi:MAG: spondin domain-containing protein [Patescibacteria group bacterium]